MKKLLAVEGKQLGPRDKRVIEPGAIYMEDEMVPVDISFNHNLVGYAKNLQREGDKVYVDIEILDKYKDQIDLEKFEARCFLSMAEYHSDTARDLDVVVTKGRLRGVGISRDWGPTN